MPALPGVHSICADPTSRGASVAVKYFLRELKRLPGHMSLFRRG
jgi:hypothetical protein